MPSFFILPICATHIMTMLQSAVMMMKLDPLTRLTTLSLMMKMKPWVSHHGKHGTVAIVTVWIF